MSVTAAVVAPAAPAAGLTVAGIGLLCAFVLALALQNLWRATFGPLLTKLGNLGISAGRGVFKFSIHPFRFVLAANDAIERALDWAVVNSERGMVWAFTRALALLKDVTHTIEQVAADVYHGIRGVQHTATKTVVRTIRETVVKPVTKTVTVTKAISASTLRAFDHRLDALTARVAHLTHALTVPVAAIPSRVGYTSKQLRRLGSRVKHLEGKLTAAAFAAGVAVALGRLGLGFLRCPSFLRATKGRKCFDYDWLSSVLDAGLLIVGTISIVEMAEALQEPTELVTEGLSKLIREF